MRMGSCSHPQNTHKPQKIRREYLAASTHWMESNLNRSCPRGHLYFASPTALCADGSPGLSYMTCPGQSRPGRSSPHCAPEPTILMVYCSSRRCRRSPSGHRSPGPSWNLLGKECKHLHPSRICMNLRDMQCSRPLQVHSTRRCTCSLLLGTGMCMTPPL